MFLKIDSKTAINTDNVTHIHVESDRVHIRLVNDSTVTVFSDDMDGHQLLDYLTEQINNGD